LKSEKNVKYVFSNTGSSSSTGFYKEWLDSAFLTPVT